jgi:hypothetical protein
MSIEVASLSNNLKIENKPQLCVLVANTGSAGYSDLCQRHQVPPNIAGYRLRMSCIYEMCCARQNVLNRDSCNQ